MLESLFEEAQKYYIYLLTNTVNGKKYLGYTQDVVRRKQEHEKMGARCQYDPVNRDNPGSYVHNAIAKYGFGNFTFEILEEGIDRDYILSRETHHINEHRTFKDFSDCNGYNLTMGGMQPIKSKESIEKQRAKVTGRKKPDGFGEKCRTRMMGNTFGVGRDGWSKGQKIKEELNAECLTIELTDEMLQCLDTKQTTESLLERVASFNVRKLTYASSVEDKQLWGYVLKATQFLEEFNTPYPRFRLQCVIENIWNSGKCVTCGCAVGMNMTTGNSFSSYCGYCVKKAGIGKPQTNTQKACASDVNTGCFVLQNKNTLECFYVRGLSVWCKENNIPTPTNLRGTYTWNKERPTNLRWYKGYRMVESFGKITKEAGGEKYNQFKLDNPREIFVN